MFMGFKVCFHMHRASRAKEMYIFTLLCTLYLHTGQFMGHDALIDTENQLLKIGDNPPFPIKEDGLWPYLNLPGKCWYAVNAGNQGERILEGTYTDYIVEDLFSTSFKYNKF